MVRTQIYLTEREQQGLRNLARQTGRSQSELIREAIDRLLETRDEPDRRALVLQAAGIWKDRTDLPDLRELRAEWDQRTADTSDG